MGMTENLPPPALWAPPVFKRGAFSYILYSRALARQRLFYQMAHCYNKGMQMFNGLNREVYQVNS